MTQDGRGVTLWGYANPPPHQAGALSYIPKGCAETRTELRGKQILKDGVITHEAAQKKILQGECWMCEYGKQG